MLYEGIVRHPHIVLGHDSYPMPWVARSMSRFDAMDLFLVRHGQPDWAPDRIARNDPGLTELGHEQARRVARRRASLDRFDELWVSSMNRAVQTSNPISGDVGTKPEVYDWL